DKTPTTFTTALAHLHTHNLPTTPPAGRPVPLPTYPFQHKRYWLDDAAIPAPQATATRHPLLGAPVIVAESDEVIFTSRLTSADLPWPVDHTVLPSSAIVEIAIAAGEEVGCATLDELTVHTALLMPSAAALRLQVKVGTAEEGRRPVTVHVRGDADEAPWRLIATGRLTDEDRHVDDSGEGEFVEVGLPEEQRREAAAYGLHPALLEAAVSHPDEGLTPAVWKGVRLHATGAHEVRARLTEIGDYTVAVSFLDADGLPVATVDSLSYERLPEERLTGSNGEVFRIEWMPVEMPEGEEPTRWAALGADVPGTQRYDDLAAFGEAAGSEDPFDFLLVPWSPSADDDPVGAAHEASGRALELVQAFLADARLDKTRLVVLFRAPEDLATGAVRGLLRSAQAETYGRVLLVDTDAENVSISELSAAVASGESEISIRGGTGRAPRLHRIPASSKTAPKTASKTSSKASPGTASETTPKATSP
ncbi:polyketide synthase dehydratase domain-containing protein, partial [Streptosporangium sp. NPDC023615]|uniref:SpnB-like Rossmann fold domain-containing protein n=1 Tax=Streptosporangium sp. NPDC023615 TaxID=3154794 RepID=UPI00341F2CCC